MTVVAETGSTNADLLAAAATLPDRTVLIADRQTAGRGRLDRTWESPPLHDVPRVPAVPGPNLLMSILFHESPTQAQPLIQRVALAAVIACERVAGVSPMLKWPNDLLLGDAKLAGILAQAGDGRVVVGIGLNVAWAPDGAACLPSGSRDDVARHLLLAFDEVTDGSNTAYRERLGTLGQLVRVELFDETFVGRAIDVEPNGSLVVETSRGRRVVTAGDVIHLRPMG